MSSRWYPKLIPSGAIANTPISAIPKFFQEKKLITVRIASKCTSEIQKILEILRRSPEALALFIETP